MVLGPTLGLGACGGACGGDRPTESTLTDRATLPTAGEADGDKPEDEEEEEEEEEEKEEAEKNSVVSACGGPGEALERPLVLPDDLRFVARFDLGDPELPAALGHLEAWARAAGAPRVAALALSQVGFQLTHLRDLLAGPGIAPPELLLVQDPGGSILWLWRLPCDLDALRGLVSAAWGLRPRSLVGGVVAEPKDPQRFPFDLVILGDERLALVPAGGGLRLLSWLRGVGARLPGPGLTASALSRATEDPGEALGALESSHPAAIHLWIADRPGGRGSPVTEDLRGDLRGDRSAGLPGGPLRAWVSGAGLTVAGPSLAATSEPTAPEDPPVP